MFLVLLLLLPGAALSAADQGPPPAPQELVELARKAADLSELGPYRLQANVVLKVGMTKELVGAITVFRDRERYRSDFEIGDYRERRWIKDDMLYISRSHQVPAPPATALRQLDRLWRPGLIPAGARVSKVSRSTQHGDELACFEISTDKDSRHKLCFNLATSVLVMRTEVESYDLEFRDYALIRQRYVPGRILFRQGSETVLEVKDISISEASLSSEAFAPPQGVPGLPTCDDPTPPHRIQYANPSIPKHELLRLRSAKVYLYGIIGTNGSIQNIAVEYSPHASFSQSAMDAIRQWRYAPAMCGDKAVPMEIETYMFYFIP